MSVRNDLPIIYATTATKEIKPVRCDADGQLLTGSGGGGTGLTKAELDSSLATSPLGTEISLVAIKTGIGLPSDIAATSDIGLWSLISLFKRLLNIKLPDAILGQIPLTFGRRQNLLIESGLLPGAATSTITSTVAGRFGISVVFEVEVTSIVSAGNYRATIDFSNDGLTWFSRAYRLDIPATLGTYRTPPLRSAPFYRVVENLNPGSNYNRILRVIEGNDQPVISRQIYTAGGQTIGTTAVLVSPNRRDRAGIYLTNCSLNNIFIDIFNNVSPTNFMFVIPPSSTLELTGTSHFDTEWYAIASAANSSLVTREISNVI